MYPGSRNELGKAILEFPFWDAILFADELQQRHGKIFGLSRHFAPAEEVAKLRNHLLFTRSVSFATTAEYSFRAAVNPAGVFLPDPLT